MTPQTITPGSMGIFSVRIRLFSLQNPEKHRLVEATVDTGALLPVIPREILRELDAEPDETRVFHLANGQRIRRSVAQIGIEYEGHRAATSVVMGEPGDASLLGSVALETLGYEADPVHKILRPTTMYMMGLAPKPRRGTSTS